MPDIEQARHLLDMARKDLAPLRLLLDPRSASPEFFGFHLQQAAEKAVKAWLCILDEDYPRTDDLARLFSQVQDSAKEFPVRFLDLLDLTGFAVQYRYDAFSSLRGELDRPSTLEKTEGLVAYVEGLLADADAPKTT